MSMLRGMSPNMSYIYKETVCFHRTQIHSAGFATLAGLRVSFLLYWFQLFYIQCWRIYLGTTYFFLFYLLFLFFFLNIRQLERKKPRIEAILWIKGIRPKRNMLNKKSKFFFNMKNYTCPLLMFRVIPECQSWRPQSRKNVAIQV